MSRKFVYILSTVLLSSGLFACTYSDDDNGGIGLCGTTCPTGMYCDASKNKCADLKAPGDNCTDNGMCKSGKCFNGFCTCNENATCSEGLECKAGACVEKTLKNVGEACGSSEDCVLGTECSSGICKAKVGTACSSPDDCVYVAFCDEETSKCKSYTKGGEACKADAECLTKSCENGVCGCNTTSDCAAHHVCDAGTCRKVESCPTDQNSKCFNALDVFPPEQSWGIGQIPVSEGDYAGSSFNLYLPRTNIVTCQHPLNVRTVLFSIFSQMTGGKKDDYCDKNSEECKLRNKPGCYMVEMNKPTPFTLVEKEGSQWASEINSANGEKRKRNFYFKFKLTGSGIEEYKQTNKQEEYDMHFTASYLNEDEHINQLSQKNRVSRVFPISTDVDVIVKHENSNCSPDKFKYDQIAEDKQDAEDNNIFACQNAFQVMVESMTGTRGEVICDNSLTACTIGTEGESNCYPLCSPNDCKTLPSYTESEVAAKSMMFGPTKISVPEKCYKETTTTVTSNKEIDYEKVTSDKDCADALPVYTGLLSTTEFIARSCRTGKVLVKELSVFVEVTDDEISK